MRCHKGVEKLSGDYSSNVLQFRSRRAKSPWLASVDCECGTEPRRIFDHGHCVNLQTHHVTMRLLATGRVLRAAKGQWRYSPATVGVYDGVHDSAGCARRLQSTSIEFLDLFVNDQRANAKQMPQQREGLKSMVENMSPTVGRTPLQISFLPYLDVYITSLTTLSL